MSEEYFSEREKKHKQIFIIPFMGGWLPTIWGILLLGVHLQSLSKVYPIIFVTNILLQLIVLLIFVVFIKYYSKIREIHRRLLVMSSFVCCFGVFFTLLGSAWNMYGYGYIYYWSLFIFWTGILVYAVIFNLRD
ncbi:MAG: hypothetical protein ACQESD_05960 [Thermoplasmatota archaeon]